MTEPLWISKRAVLALHNEQIAEHGGAPGIRDENLLDSALAKPQNVFACSEHPDLFRLAASYAFGIARNHAFVDGNKRTALVISLSFLVRNGWKSKSSKEDLYLTFVRLPEGSVTEDELAAWFASHAVAL